MSPILFVCMLLISIAVLMFLIMKIKLHPVMSLFFTALTLGILTGGSIKDTLDTMSSGFGSTLGSIGFTLILGSILAMSIQDTGASTSIANFFIKLFKGKNLELAPSLTGFITSIPVFGDITTILMSPIASILAKRKKESMSTYCAMTNIGLNLTHALVPPTPGILAITIMFAADLGLVIGYGIIIGLIALFLSWLILRKWCKKEFIEPREDLADGYEAAKDMSNIDELIIKESYLPSAFVACLPLLIPVILISIASFANAYLPEDSSILPILLAIGHRVSALLAGVISACIIALTRKQKVIDNANKHTHEGEKCNTIYDVILNNWVYRGLKVALLPLLITGVGGAFSTIIKNNPAIEELGLLVSDLRFPAILLPFLISVVLMSAVGSMTTAGMTAAGIVLPLLPYLQLTPLAAVLSIGCGTMMFNHVSNSGFWVTSQFFNLNTKQGLKYITVPNAVGGLCAMVIVVILHFIGLF